MLLMICLLLFGSTSAFAKSPSLNKTKVTLIAGRTKQLKVKNAGKKKVVWSSNNKKIASVSKSGLVKAKKAGTCKITARVGNKKLKCKVKVQKKGLTIVPMTQLARYSYFSNYMSYSQFEEAYKIAYKMLLPLEGLSKKNQLYGIASILREYYDKYMTYSMTKEHYNDPYGYLVLKCASCAGCVRTTGMMLNMLGMNYEHVNENQYSHQWARVKVGGKYWICDAYGLYCGPEPGERKHPRFR